MLYDKYERFDGLALEDLPFVMLNPVRSVYTDEDKTLWFGTKGDGFVRIKEYDSYAKGEIPLDRIAVIQRQTACLTTGSIAFSKACIIPWCGLVQTAPAFLIILMRMRKSIRFPAR